MSYLHSDRLGSPVSITEKALPANGKLGNAAPSLVEHRGFDAFGKALDGVWGTSNNGMVNLGSGQLYNFGKRNQRGFTGHEHLDEFALIHMNGRAYDYNLGRFLGVDPIIQFPANSQSLNPYSYLMNNPLSGTDPTGYAIFLAAPWAAGTLKAAGVGLGIWTAYETVDAVATGTAGIISGESTVGEAIYETGKSVAIGMLGGKFFRIAEKLIPDSVANKVESAVSGKSNGADKEVGRTTGGSPDDIGEPSKRKQDELAIGAARSAAEELKRQGADRGAVTARVSIDSEGRVTTTTTPSEKAAGRAGVERESGDGTGCRPSCGEGPNIKKGEEEGAQLEGSSMATVRIDGKRVKQPDGSYRLIPGKEDGKLKPACEQGCSATLEKRGIRDAVKLCGDKPCDL